MVTMTTPPLNLSPLYIQMNNIPYNLAETSSFIIKYPSHRLLKQLLNIFSSSLKVESDYFKVFCKI